SPAASRAGAGRGNRTAARRHRLRNRFCGPAASDAAFSTPFRNSARTRPRDLSSRPMIWLLLTVLLTPDPNLFSELKWRGIGPLRGGRTKSATGVPGQRGVFYIGVCNGGVWKTTDYGRTWTPLFDEQPTGSIGAVAVAPSNPSVIYVGS